MRKPLYRRSVISDEISADLEPALKVAVEFGLDGIELRNLWGKRIDQLIPEELARAKTHIGEAGLVCSAIASPFFKAKLDDLVEMKDHRQILLRSIEAAHALGTSLVRGFTFWKDQPLESAYDRVLEAYGEPIRIAAGEGITLVIENEASTFIATGQELARFISDLGTPVVRALWDPGNAYWDVQREVAYPLGYEAIKALGMDAIAHVHIKDAKTNPESGKLEWVALGQGEIRIADNLEALENDGYRGFVSLETHYRKARLPDEMLRSPSGSLFSESGAQASIECLQNWDGFLGSSRS